MRLATLEEACRAPRANGWAWEVPPYAAAAHAEYDPKAPEHPDFTRELDEWGMIPDVLGRHESGAVAAVCVHTTDDSDGGSSYEGEFIVREGGVEAGDMVDGDSWEAALLAAMAAAERVT